MTQLTADEVRHIAKLARLELSESDLEKYATEMTSILKYIDMLGEVDTKNVQATAGGTELHNRLRTDDVQNPTNASPDALLATSPLPITVHQIDVPSAHG